MTTLDYAPFTPFMDARTRKLPGIGPLNMAEWLHRDDAYAAQMAEREALIRDQRDVVFAETPEVAGPAGELQDLVLSHLATAPGHRIDGDHLIRPDGGRAPLTGDHPLALLGAMAQEDFCILWRPEDEEEHILIGAILCFPSRWLLAEKLGKPLIGIHDRVPNYDAAIAPRVQRMFDALRPETPLVRANWLVHTMPDLHQPLTEEAKTKWGKAPSDRFWLRVERQCLLRLPHSGAVVFSIKTCITPVEALTSDQRAGLAEALAATTNDMRIYHGGLPHHDRSLAALNALT